MCRSMTVSKLQQCAVPRLFLSYSYVPFHVFIIAIIVLAIITLFP